MTDLEFAGKISEQIGVMYRDAKNSCLTRPEFALSRLRSVTSLCCDAIANTQGGRVLPTGLEDKINKLDEGGLINHEIKDILHQLRQAGNKGAHPEQYTLSKEQFVKIAKEALQSTRELLGQVFQIVKNGAAIPDYAIAEIDQADIQTLCFQALMDADPDAMYQIGMLLRLNAADAMKKASEEAIAVDMPYFDSSRSHDFQKRSMTLLRLASDREHPAACYECGIAMVQGDEFFGGDQVRNGEILIHRASESDDINAIAWVGAAYMRGTDVIDVDYSEARTHLERAAEHDHPEALCNLAALHYEGLGVPSDHRLALKYSLRAAHAGYPLAQYNAFVLLSKGEGATQNLDSAYDWLRQAAEVGQADACFALGRLKRKGELKSESFSEIEMLLTRALVTLNEATYEISMLYHAQGQTNGHAILAMHHLQNCYEKALNEKDERLACKCIAKSEVIVSNATRLMRSMSDTELKAFIQTRLYFDKQGHPYPNRNEQFQRNYEDIKRLASLKGRDDVAYKRLVNELAKGIVPEMRALPDIRTSQLPTGTLRNSTPKIGRNDQCHCGSGRKFKACCL
jgi:TPR repeat protein